MKLLVIEDNLDMRENIVEILELANYEVIDAENGKVGVNLAKKHQPDLIICDIMMPELDGYGVLYLLTRDPETSSIPFIFLTAKAEKSDLRKGMNLGADDYLTKPFEETELLNAIESRLDRSRVFKEKFEPKEDSFANFLDEAKGLEELKDLSKDKKVRHFKKKDIIYHEGDYPNGIFLVTKGKVRAYILNDDAKEYNIGLFGEGDFLGYMPILKNTDHIETAQAMEEVELLKIPKNDFLNLLSKNRDVAAQFIKMLAGNVIENEKQLLNLAYDSVRKRVADSLVVLHDKFNQAGEDAFKIAIPRSSLASIVGTSPETVIRTLSDFKDEKLIKIKGSTIKIINLEGLRHLRF